MEGSLTLQPLLRVSFHPKFWRARREVWRNWWPFGELCRLTSIKMSTKPDKNNQPRTWSNAAAFDNIFGPPLVLAPTPVATPVFGHGAEAQSFGGGKDAANAALDPVSAQARRNLALNTTKTFLRNVTLTENDLLKNTFVNKMAECLAEYNTHKVHGAMALALKNWPNHTGDQEDLVSFT
jgi:hypothetical protein